MTESNEQFHYSRSLEANLARYLWGTRLYLDGVSAEDARESAYLESLGNLYDIVEKLESDPIRRDQIMRDVMPARFDEHAEDDDASWVSRLQIVPSALIRKGVLAIDREDIDIKFFDGLLGWVVRYSEGHSASCATGGSCAHDLPSHHETCPVRTTGEALSNEITLLYFKLHSEYMAHSLVEKLEFFRERIESVSDFIVRHGMCSRERAEAFLFEREDEAIRYASMVNGLATLDDSIDG